MSRHGYDIRVSESCVDPNPYGRKTGPSQFYLFPDTRMARIKSSRISL